MSNTDPIALALTTIRNAIQARHPEANFPMSNIKQEICRILKKEHFIKDYEVIKDSQQGHIKVVLSYGREKQPVINSLKRISKPSQRNYRGYKEMKPVKGGVGILIISTPRGIMTNKECRQAKLGGEVICEVW